MRDGPKSHRSEQIEIDLVKKEALPTQPALAARAAIHPRDHVWVVFGYLAIALAALLPRVLALGLFITDDEANFWLMRSDIFLKAIRSGDFAATAITAHPGVTTMWLGAAGIVLRRALLDWGFLHSDAFPVVLTLMRLPAVLVHVGVIVLGYGLLRRMFLPKTYPALAFLAALLWAADPFVIGYSKLLHTDALAGSFMTLSILSACVYWLHDRRNPDVWRGMRWLALSGVAAGLAFLSKSPALVLAPAVGLVALLGASSVSTRGALTAKTPRTPRALHAPFQFQSWRSWRLGGLDMRSFVQPLVVWAIIAVITVFALWPALWVSPLQAYAQLRVGVEVEGAQPHMLGNFFLGREDDAPGPLYYPAALALRTTPWTLLGLLLLPIVWRRVAKLSNGEAAASRRSLAALAGFVILFVVAMSVFPKKFDRYMVPAFPALDVLSAVGLLGVGEWGLGIRGWGLGVGRKVSSIVYRLSSIVHRHGASSRDHHRRAGEHRLVAPL